MAPLFSIVSTLKWPPAATLWDIENCSSALSFSSLSVACTSVTIPSLKFSDMVTLGRIEEYRALTRIQSDFEVEKTIEKFSRPVGVFHLWVLDLSHPLSHGTGRSTVCIWVVPKNKQKLKSNVLHRISLNYYYIEDTWYCYKILLHNFVTWCYKFGLGRNGKYVNWHLG